MINSSHHRTTKIVGTTSHTSSCGFKYRESLCFVSVISNDRSQAHLEYCTPWWHFLGNLVWNKRPRSTWQKASNKKTSSRFAVKGWRQCIMPEFCIWVQTEKRSLALHFTCMADFCWKKTCVCEQRRNNFVLKGSLKTCSRQGTQMNAAAPSLLDSWGTLPDCMRLPSLESNMRFCQKACLDKVAYILCLSVFSSPGYQVIATGNSHFDLLSEDTQKLTKHQSLMR